MCETVGKPESSHQQQKHPSVPSYLAHQRKVRKKPSLKWKFCHAVASMVKAHANNARNTVNDLTGSASESSMEDNKSEIPVVRASSAHSKKKKKRKSTVGQKKSRHISSASTSGKQSSSKKLVKN